MADHQDGFDSLSLDWLRAKPGAKWGQNRDVLNAWVADMDFPPPPVVATALHDLVDAGDLGYPAWALEHSPALDAFVHRAATRYDWHIDAADCRELNDVTQGIQIALEHHTQPGDGVVVLQPSYPPFLGTVSQMGRRLVPLNGERDTASPTGWAFDWDELDRTLAADPAKVLLLCHPHNPTGHVFGDDELRRIAAVAERHDLLIISDEIHADLTFTGHAHRPIACFAPARTVTLHAASKAFNLAGLRYAVMHIGPDALRARVNAVANHLYGEPNLFGAAAAHAAWTGGDEWLAAVLSHLDRQRHLAVELLRDALPEVVATPPASTYLLWLDCRALGFGDDPSEEFLRRGVRLNEGPEFGARGLGHTRLNFATSSAVLRQIVERMATPPAR
ncbi:MAG: hypothetical protein RJA49_2803 [Actinomycetota bacterium]